jgi:hypothetical protein
LIALGSPCDGRHIGLLGSRVGEVGDLGGGWSRGRKGGRGWRMLGARVIVRGSGRFKGSLTLASDHMKAAASVARQRQTLLRRTSDSSMLW